VVELLVYVEMMEQVHLTLFPLLLLLLMRKRPVWLKQQFTFNTNLSFTQFTCSLTHTVPPKQAYFY